MTVASDIPQDELTYRKREVDETLNDHESRITRLEQTALIGVGYGIASGADIVTQLAQFL